MYAMRKSLFGRLASNVEEKGQKKKQHIPMRTVQSIVARKYLFSVKESSGVESICPKEF